MFRNGAILLILLCTTSCQAQDDYKLKLQQVLSEVPDPPVTETAPEGRVVGPGLFRHRAPVREVYSEASDRFVGTQNGSLYVRANNTNSIKKVLDPAPGWQWNVLGSRWSKDGKFLMVRQMNDQQVPRIELTLESEETIEWPYSRAGEPIPEQQYYVVDVESKKAVKVEHDPLNFPYVHVIGWTDSGKAWLIRLDRFGRYAEILEADPQTGKTRSVFRDLTQSFHFGLAILIGNEDWFSSMNNVVLLPEAFLWQSEESGFRQIHMYDHDGKLIREVTASEENGLVHAVLEVADSSIYFLASGSLEILGDRHLYRADIYGNNIERIIDGPVIYPEIVGDSIEVMRADGLSNVTVEMYTRDGELVRTVWKPDLGFLKEADFDPEIVILPTSDGKSVTRSLILKPMDFDPSASYPVVEHIYGGAFTREIPDMIIDRSLWELQQLADAGFIVVITDSRGTPGRGKEYQDYIYGRMGQVEIADHANALRQLAAERPYMDMDRVGVQGHSWGGYFALRAAILWPDLYKAAHLSAPSVDLSTMRVPVEIYMGCVPQDCPEAYADGDNTNKIDRLKASLQIIHGTADDDVPIEESYRLTEALEKSGYSDFEFIVYPGSDHIVMRDPRWLPSMITFFEEKLNE